MANEGNKQPAEQENRPGQEAPSVTGRNTAANNKSGKTREQDETPKPAATDDKDSGSAAGETPNDHAETSAGTEQPRDDNEDKGKAGEAPETEQLAGDEVKLRDETNDAAEEEDQQLKTAEPGAGSRQPPLGMEAQSKQTETGAGEEDPAKGQPEPGPEGDPHRGAGDTLSQHRDLDADAARNNDKEGFPGIKTEPENADDAGKSNENK